MKELCQTVYDNIYKVATEANAFSISNLIMRWKGPEYYSNCDVKFDLHLYKIQ